MTDTDEAQERVEGVLSSEKVEQIRGYWRDWYPTTPHAVSGCECQECRTWKDIIDLCDSHERLRARQREDGGRCSTCGFPVGHAFGCGEDGPDDDDTSLPLDTFVEGLGTVRECRGCRALLAGGPTRCVRCAEEGDPGATPQREGEREPVADLEACREAYDALSRQHAEFRRSIRSELWRFWPNNLGVGNDEIVRAVDEALDTEPPAEPDLDELTPRCPACRETMHDCECNPYMDTEESDGR